MRREKRSEKRRGERERRGKREERGERRVGPMCHVDELTLNGQFNTV